MTRGSDADPGHLGRFRGRPAGATLLALASTSLIAVVGVAYVAVILSWLALERTPMEPIGDPYLLLMEILTIVSALGIGGLVISLFHLAGPARSVAAVAAVGTGLAGAVLTSGVHFVQITAVRQLWAAGELEDYRLVWPSWLFAVEYLAWDALIGLTMVLVWRILDALPGTRIARLAFLTGGVLCLMGIVGPVSGHMGWQNLALAGYAVFLPAAAALLHAFLRRMTTVGGPSLD